MGKRQFKIFVDKIEEKEEWKDIRGYEGEAQVSNYGRVRTVDRVVVYSQTNQYGPAKELSCKHIKGKMLSPKSDGYVRVGLCDREFYVHRLVAANFIRPLRPKEEVNHIDGNKENNHISNLEICTRVENQAHAYHMGINTRFHPATPVIVDGVYYETLGEAERATKIPKSFLLRILENPNTKRRKWKNAKIEPVKP